ncbi:hypothetical protein DFH08DRAFT_702130 [Mycena albidolilacea]|uniref:Histone H1 n=1 Tax=Mycena albidolilacea TaxID=1033008 RepID=A0AAD7EP78_9AGAR|nr:hypothetical protein DFH08DRAFT_702130 [Mycena albidolilacea]
MPTAPKKSTTKASTKASGASKSRTHPAWVDMIKECIIAHPEDARGGVSRPTIKKFVESKYKVELNPSTASQLNRAITSGSERGTFVLPKGPSGKVKLTPKVRGEAAKEVCAAKPASKPAAKKPASAKKPALAKKTTASAKKVSLSPQSLTGADPQNRTLLLLLPLLPRR